MSNKLSGAAKRFNLITQFIGKLARRSSLDIFTSMLTKSLAKGTVILYRGKPRTSVEEITHEWRRMFPKEICSVEKVEGDTGYGLVHADCSLVGTGDVKACYKMMEYDRAIIERLGGQLVVLESRANPKVQGRCRVAIRKKGVSTEDLIPAHLLD